MQANSPNLSERAYLINNITKLLSLPTPDDSKVKERWEVLWNDTWANGFRRKDFEDFWLWSNKFYDAEEEDLRKLYKLISKI